ncbi:OVARIAN TUMOR DOMAIN-containing deubiquitinating enzyme 7 isoform X4 [Magnolia sinica]|uniref:OVARIAN TUMOR DOMAIN-containing deubiquitinating enzyme 7 isoform X4 n=1 Tax=Magnolia sinica TaxID=86752 RepID=UPI00265A9FA4|nr:OVARIAN TUMOR DOMAIN-containing deubiquitinating enzyme 7 isoform X4 [Magnolia sinica]
MSFGRQVKKHGKPANIAQFHPQLDSLGLKIIQVTADGNCFFRALADQLEGNEEEHGKYRHMVVQYIMKHRQEFEPFIEDDVPFDEYCKSMEKDGTWAGNMELQAASLVTRSNICIHRVMSPRWYIRNFDSRGTCMIHLSYHDGEHYNSIRLKEDPGNGPARQIVIKADVDLSATPRQSNVTITKSKATSSQNMIDAAAVKIVMAGTGCENGSKVEQVLQELDGDIDAAIETLRAGVGTDEDLVEHDEFPDENVANNGHYENGDYEDPEAPQQSKIPDPNRASDDLQIHDDDSSQPDDKKIPRNKACPCGSKKKYKACCGTRTRKSSPEPVIRKEVTISKGKKGRKQNRVGGPAKSAPSQGPKADPPDMGALCI